MTRRDSIPYPVLSRFVLFASETSTSTVRYSRPPEKPPIHKNKYWLFGFSRKHLTLWMRYSGKVKFPDTCPFPKEQAWHGLQDISVINVTDHWHAGFIHHMTDCLLRVSHHHTCLPSLLLLLFGSHTQPDSRLNIFQNQRVRHINHHQRLWSFQRLRIRIHFLT